MEENKKFTLLDILASSLDLGIMTIQKDDYKAVLLCTDLSVANGIEVALTIIARCYDTIKDGNTIEQVNAVKQELREHLEHAFKIVDKQ